MTVKSFAAAAIAAAICLMPASGRCQSNALISQLSGANVPSVQKLADIGTAAGHWFRFRLADTSGMGGYLGMMGSMFGGSESSDFYTSGQQVTIGDSAFLLAYSVQTKPMDWASMMRSGTPAPPAPLSGEAPLAPALLNLRAIPGMVDIQPFDLQTVITESTQQTGMVSKLIGTETQAAHKAISTEGESNAKQIMLGVIEYTQDNDNRFPPMTSAAAFKKAIYPYIKSDSVFIDPATGSPFVPNRWFSKKSLNSVNSPASMVAIYSTPHSDGTRVIGFTDGHVKLLDAGAWTAAKTASHIP